MTFAVSLCPHCGRQYGGIRFGLNFGPVAVRIIDTVQRAGPDGIDGSELFEIVYGQRTAARQALKGYVRVINHHIRQFSDQKARIVFSGNGRYGGVYRIEEAA